jgi:hypothetical protein
VSHGYLRAAPTSGPQIWYHGETRHSVNVHEGHGFKRSCVAQKNVEPYILWSCRTMQISGHRIMPPTIFLLKFFSHPKARSNEEIVSSKIVITPSDSLNTLFLVIFRDFDTRSLSHWPELHAQMANLTRLDELHLSSWTVIIFEEYSGHIVGFLKIRTSAICKPFQMDEFPAPVSPKNQK